jgi:hypothetical protein
VARAINRIGARKSARRARILIRFGFVWLRRADVLVWEGVVETFDLEGYPTANRCYAFEFARDTGNEIKLVLSVPGVDSPLKALMAAIAASH